MKYILWKQAMGLSLVSMMFLSYNLSAMEPVMGKVTNSAVVDFTQSSQSIQAVLRTDNRERQMPEQIEEQFDLKAVVKEQIDRLDKEYWNLVIAQVSNYVNVRALPSEDGEVVGKLYNHSVGEYLAEENGWYYITSGNVTGYVKAEYCVIGAKAAKLAEEILNSGSEFVSAESKEEEAARLAKEKRKQEEIKAAAKEKAKTAVSTSAEPTENGIAVANFACQFVGNPYKWGGTSLTEGADCSGFVMSVYANFGVELPHSSGSLRKSGYEVGSLSEAIPGDIICYSGHVGIYIGEGQIVHASSKKTGIIISDAEYKPIVKIRRIF